MTGKWRCNFIAENKTGRPILKGGPLLSWDLRKRIAE
jgi:hypothetical protein